MLKLKPRLAFDDIPPHHLRRKKCTICGEKYLGLSGHGAAFLRSGLGTNGASHCRGQNVHGAAI
jgi:hypothetical protein